MLKERQLKVLEYIKMKFKENGLPPSVREIQEALDIKSTSTVQSDLVVLIKEGYIRKESNKQRTLMVVDPETQEPLFNNNKAEHRQASPASQIVDVPVVGRVAAGVPITASEHIEDYFPISKSLISDKVNFMLRVKGESMIEAGILNGDLILVEQTNMAENGDIVVALIDGIESEATVKTFYKENGHIRLQPENSTMSPIIVNDCQIVGKVKGVFRYYN